MRIFHLTIACMQDMHTLRHKANQFHPQMCEVFRHSCNTSVNYARTNHVIVIRAFNWREKDYCIEYATNTWSISFTLFFTHQICTIHSLNPLFQPIPTILRKESSKNTIICSFITLMQLSTSTNNSTSFFSSLAVYLSFLFSHFPSSPSFYLQLLHQHHLKTKIGS